MYNPTQILIEGFIEQLRYGYRRMYGRKNPDFEDIIGWIGSMALENIANSDALYHNVEHTIFVTLVGQEILRGKHIKEGRVSPTDWMHFIVSLVCHDIGYVRGVCSQDHDGLYASGKNSPPVRIPAGSTDAGMTPYHVDRGKLFVEERFSGHDIIDVEIIKRNIELTRFPVPNEQDHQDTTHFPGLVRASDLIGQLSDPRYLKKIAALFYEFEETGFNKRVGFENPDDLRANYPSFYWKAVYPYVKDSLRYLSTSQVGSQIVANLQSNVFMVEHEADTAAASIPPGAEAASH
jgi:hypothetical protein